MGRVRVAPRLRRTSVAAIALTAWLGVLPPAASPQEPSPGAAATPSPSPFAPTPIPAAEVLPAGEDLASFLRSIERLIPPGPHVEDVAARMPSARAGIDLRLESTSEMVTSGAQLHALDHLASAWQTVRYRIHHASTVVSARVAELDGTLDQLDGRRQTWTATRTAVVADRAPAAIVERADRALAELGRARETLIRARARAVDLQSEVVSGLVDVDRALAQISDARLASVQNTLRRDSRAVWNLDFGKRVREEMLPRVQDLLSFELAEAAEWADAHASGLLLQAGVLVLLCVLFRRARRMVDAWVEAEPEIAQKAAVLQLPYSSALILTIVQLRAFYLQAPHLFVQGLAIVAVIPVLRLLRLAAPAEVRPAVWVLSAFFLLDQLRDFVAALPQLEQVLFLVECIAALLLVAWLRAGRSARARRLVAALRLPRPAATLEAVLGILALAATAGTLGYMQLARLLGGSVLVGTYIAGGLYVAVRAAEGLLALALRDGPIARLRIAERHRTWLEASAHWILVRISVVFWGIAVLRFLAIDQLAWGVLTSILATPVAPALWGVTIGDVFATGVVVWAAFAVARTLRFVLEEEVYPRIDLPRGIPYAMTTLLQYGVLVGGFLLALGAIGLDLTRVTILAGAFGVGIGFGLQNVVNNFVSGLILLFERPVQVGDSVQIGELMGEVRRIGIRSSTVRTWQGAEVIVPNGNLIAEPVTNWTLSDRMRRIDLPVGVAYGSDPDRVLEILRDVGRAHPAVMPEPAPVALFLRFGDSSLDFELRAWTNRFEQYVFIRSELGIAVLRALRAAAIEIPFPQRDLHVRSDATPAVATAAATDVDTDVARAGAIRTPADTPAQGES